MPIGPKKIRFIENFDGAEVKQEDESDSFLPHGNKKARIIVRNLPFKNLSEDKMKEWFGKYGDIEEVKLLTKSDGKYVGCGFVQFTKVGSAANAIQEANEKEISGRKVIVDWAVPKKVYEESLKELKIKKEPGDDGSYCGEELPYWMDNQPRNEIEDEDDEDEDEDEGEGEGEDEDEDIKPYLNEKDNKKYTKHNMKSHKKPGNDDEKKFKIKSNDVQEGQTIFVRNLPFSATNEDLKQCFSKYGALEYALVCIDKLTEHSKGTGFVKFKDKTCAQHCLSQNNKIFIEDNPLYLSLAMSKEDLENKKQKKEAKDSRNLYLSKEGVVMAGSTAANGVSAADMAKRLEIEHYKSQMLKNLNMFVSDRRLIVHNLPPTYNEAQLKALFLKYSHPKAVITECRVMRDKKNFDGKTGLGISKEYGFVTFKNHDDALLALRNINNNPKIFSVKKRPIVGFSIESKAVINLKKKRMEKSRIKLGINDEAKLTKLNRKQRRFIKRRQMIIEKRREKKKQKKESSDGAENTNKRKTEGGEDVKVVSKKRKLSKETKNENVPGEHCGTVSERGTKVKMRSRYKLKNQERIHKQHLKEEKSKRLKNKKKKMENYKQPKQKKTVKHVEDDSNVGKLIQKHKKELESVASYKKWDET